MEIAEIWVALEKFRKSEYFHDVINQRFLQQSFYGVLESVPALPDEDFLDSLRQALVALPMLRERTVDPILNNNSIHEIRKALAILLDGDSTVYDTLDAVWSLSEAGKFFSSYMLALVTGGEYIVYEDRLFDGMRAVAPQLVKDISRVRSVEDYLHFMKACRVLIEVFDFTSCAELHEFLWHGNDTEWTFE